MLSDWLVFCNCGFLSVCPLMKKDKRLMDTSSWERLTEGETQSCASGPITSWQIDEETVETVTDYFGASKSLQMVIADMKLKDTLLLGRKVMTNLDSILKTKDITLPTKVCLVKAMVFFSSHVWM